MQVGAGLGVGWELAIIGFMLRVYLLMGARDGQQQQYFLSLRMACCERPRGRMDVRMCDATLGRESKQIAATMKLCEHVV
jgi:hypothetical protein